MLLDTVPARARAVAAAVTAYPAIEAPAPDPARVAAALDEVADEVGLASRLLRAGAAGREPGVPEAALPPRATVHRRMLARLLDEALLGDDLFEAVRGEAPRWIHGRGTLEPVGPGPSLESVRRGGAGRPLALVSHRTAPEVLYLLLRFQVSEVFDAVVTAGEGPPVAPQDLPALYASAARRVGASVARVGTRADRVAAEAAGLRVERAP